MLLYAGKNVWHTSDANKSLRSGGGPFNDIIYKQWAQIIKAAVNGSSGFNDQRLAILCLFRDSHNGQIPIDWHLGLAVSKLKYLVTV